MTSVFNQIHRLKQQPGWTWDHFLCEVDKLVPAGLDEKTLYSHYRQPHKKPTIHVTRVINTLHEHCFPNPFPEAVNGLMRLYNNLERCKKHLTRDSDIDGLERFLLSMLEREVMGDSLWLARVHWLAGNINFDRISIYRDNGQRQALEEAKHKAIAHYQNSVASIERYNAQSPKHPVGAHHLYKAHHNILACYLNAVPQERRNVDPEIHRYLKESNYIPGSKHTLELEPFQWTIARDGLRFSSLVHNAADVDEFFRALINVSDRFLDLDYRPLNQGPISAGVDFRWAIDNVLTQDYLSAMKLNKRK